MVFGTLGLRVPAHLTLPVLSLLEAGSAFSPRPKGAPVPARLSPPPLSAYGQRATAAGFEQMGLRPGLPLALLSGGGELGGGFLIAAGLVTPLGTALLAAVMTVAILVVHLRRGIWAAAGGFEFPLLMLTSRLPVEIRNPGGPCRSSVRAAGRSPTPISASCRSLAEKRRRPQCRPRYWATFQRFAGIASRGRIATLADVGSRVSGRLRESRDRRQCAAALHGVRPVAQPTRGNCRANRPSLTT